MKKFIPILLLFTVIVSPVYSQVMWQVTSDNTVMWNYLDGDEFSSATIDTSLWQNSFPWGRNLYCNKEQQYYTDWKNHITGKGVLRLEARKEQVTEVILDWEKEDAMLKCNERNAGFNKRTFPFTSGMIFSKKKYHYGYYEIRFSSSAGKGLWPAFWLYAGHDSDEIDVFEIKGERNNELHVDVHCSSGCKNYKTTLGLLRKNWGDYLPASAGWHEGFNVIGMEWRPGFIKWFLNGEGIAYWKGNFVFPMWVIANLAIPSDNGPFGPGPDNTTPFPANFDIDYIRIWSDDVTSAKKREHLEKFSVNATGNKAAYPAGRKRPEYKRANLKMETAWVTMADISNEEIMILITGKVGLTYSLEVSDAGGKVIYQSSDPAVNEHIFRKHPGKHFMKMRINQNLIEHIF